MVLSVGIAQARDDSVWDRVTLSVEGFSPDISSSVRFDTSNLQPGTDLNLEADLNLSDNDTLYQFLATIRLTDRMSIDARYFQLGREADAVLTGDITFGDTVFPVSADVHTVLDTDILTVSGSYALWKDDRVEFSASLGAYILSVKAAIDTAGQGTVSSLDASAPLPLFGAKLLYRLTPRVLFQAQAEYLSGEIQDFSGSISSYRVGLQFNMMDGMGIGVGYSAFDLELDSTYKDFPGRLAYEYKGPAAFITLRF